MSGMVEKVKAKVDNVLHKDKSSSDPTGPHNSHAANQADPRVDSDHIGSHGNTGSAAHGTTHTSTTGTHTGTGMTGTHAGTTDPTGPHDSRMANKADPRVDSDRYGAAGNTTGAHTGTTGMAGTHTGVTGSDPTGPHDSRLANKADPRVDSDRVGGAGNYGSAAHGTTHTGTTGTHTGMTGSHVGSTGTDPTGPHDSRMANKADPRVDSDRYGSAGNHTGMTGTTGTHTGAHTGTTGMTGTHTGMAGSDPTGPHDSRMANKADPRVDSDRVGAAGNYGTTGAHTGTTGTHTGMTGTHTGTHTGMTGSDPSGPHDSHLANKADPRVDSDRYGAAGNTGSAAYGTTHTGTTGTTHTGNLAHRDNETGDLPKALVEPQSHAVPHSSTQTGTHGSTGVHGTHGATDVHGTHGTSDVHGKPSMMDKLNPKKDADFDGKRGIMD
jgi:hypothetical protein